MNVTPCVGSPTSRLILLVCTLAASITPAAVTAQTFEALAEFERPGRYPGKLFEDTDGSFYGTFSGDGPRDGGGLFRWTSNGSFTVVHAFDTLTVSGRAGGFTPNARVVKGPDGAIYGTTWQGGANDGGTLFRWDGTALTTVFSFPSGSGPREIIAGIDGYLYGTLASGCGVLYRFDPATNNLETLHTFPCSTTVRQTLSESLSIDAQGTIYGVTASHTGSAAGELGTIFRWDAGGLTTLHTFTGGAGAALSVIKGVDGAMYGATWPGGTCRCGTLFKRSSTAAFGATVSTLLQLSQNTYITGLTQDGDGALYASMAQIGSSGSGFVAKVQGATLSPPLRSFAGEGEGFPNDVLLTADGRLAGTTGRSGALPHGILFRMAKDGTQFIATALDNGQPRLPNGSLVHMPDGSVYGTTQEGGLHDRGTLYKRDESGQVTTLHSFAGPDGWRPSGLILAADGNMYGTTQFGGTAGGGTLFRWDGATLQRLHSFSLTDGRAPQSPVVAASDGSFYGTTSAGGLSGKGTLYRWQNNAFIVLHHFDGWTGSKPTAPLVEGADGGIYGVTPAGGEHGAFSDFNGGTLFKWRDGALTVLRSFGASATDPSRPSSLLRTADGSLFGTSYGGGQYFGGTLFKFTDTQFDIVHNFPLANGNPHSIAGAPDGSIVGVSQFGGDDDGQFLNFGSVFRWNGASLSILHTFDLTQATGTFPRTITLGTDGRLYGSTLYGGSGGGGTLFRVTLNAPPVITSVTGASGPIPVDTAARFTVSYSDREPSGHTCTFAWGDGQPNTSVAGTGGICSATHAFSDAGVYTVTVTVADPGGLSDTEPSSFVVVYDPEAGFVTGNGWIQSPAGAYVANPTLEGRANFAFVSRYQRGATVPTGQTEFHFHVASFRFTSTSYDWLVVSGARAQFKGRGTINGAGDYGFLLTATDGNVSGGGGTDRFRVKIWHISSGLVVYDNVGGASDTLSGANPQTIQGGSIIIHAK